MRHAWIVAVALIVLAAGLPALTGGAEKQLAYTNSAVLCSKGKTQCKKLSTFCLAPSGNLLVCDQSGMAVKVVSPDDKLVATLKVEFAPKAVHATAEGEVYVGGTDKFVKMNAAGKVIKKFDASSLGLERAYVAAITTSKEELFISMRGRTGYEVYRFDRDFGGGKRIISKLRGCCGQMDIAAHGDSVYVAENARHRVTRYDREGKELTSWGKRDRTSQNGFGGCCNPMNLCIGPDGNVYTSESGTGLIKRYTLDGKYLGLVGTVAGTSGCKHVRIAASVDGSRLYVADVTKNVIYVLAGAKQVRATVAAKAAK